MAQSYSWNDVAIPDDILAKWQTIIDTISQIMKVPTGLIMRVHPPTIEVLLASNSEGNPYELGETAALPGLYCNAVLNSCQMLLVPNALNDPNWAHNPDVKLNMISYLGFPLRWPNGDFFGTICVLDSVTNAYNDIFIKMLDQFRHIIEDQLTLIMVNQELMKANKLKTRMMGILSHDLRNPLTVIQNCAELLHESTIKLTPKETKECYAMINDSTNYMSSLINRILDIATVEEGSLDFHPETVNYQNFLENIVARNQIIAKQYNIKLKLTYTSPNAFVSIDPMSIEQALNNLLSNAFKFTPNQSTIELKVESESAKNITTKVIDKGIGIPKEDLPHISKYFTRGSFKNIRDQKSLGLGLAIVKKVIDSHQGNFGVSSEVGKGSTFYFTLPIVDYASE